MLDCLWLRIRTEVRYKSFAEVLIIIIFRLTSRASSATGWPTPYTSTSIARLSVHVITGAAPLIIVKGSLLVVIGPRRCGTIPTPIIVRVVIACGDSAHGRLLLAAHSALEKLQVTSCNFKFLPRVVRSIATHWGCIVSATIPIRPELLLSCALLLVLGILRGRRFKVIIFSLRCIGEAATIGGWAMGGRSHILILNWMRYTRSVILTSRSIDVGVVVILLSPRALHHLIVLIHLVLVSRITSADLLRIWWLPTWMLVAEPHCSWSRHPTRSILRLLARVGYSPSRVARLLRKPAAACGHQHAPVCLWRV